MLYYAAFIAGRFPSVDVSYNINVFQNKFWSLVLLIHSYISLSFIFNLDKNVHLLAKLIM